MDCLFCAIVSGAIPADVVYRDEKVVVFNDINPQAPKHLLVVPIQHLPTLNDLQPKDSELIGYMVQTAKDVAKKLGIDEAGYRLVFNCNAGAGQTVFHIHLHLLGGRVFKWPPG